MASRVQDEDRPIGLAAKAQDAALDRAGDVFMWAVNTGGSHPDATPEGAAEQIVAAYLRAVVNAALQPSAHAAETLLGLFPEKRR